MPALAALAKIPEEDPKPVSVKEESINAKSNSPSEKSSVPGHSTSTAARAKQGAKKRKDHCPCKVCGQKFADMPAGFPYCYDHKSDAETCHAQLVGQARKDPNNEELQAILKDFEDARDAADQPPSKFSSWVLKYAQNCPAQGRGQKRKIYDYVSVFLFVCFCFQREGPDPLSLPRRETLFCCLGFRSIKWWVPTLWVDPPPPPPRNGKRHRFQNARAIPGIPPRPPPPSLSPVGPASAAPAPALPMHQRWAPR
jgi:hypothetical protein